jgi:hypothetical protein
VNALRQAGLRRVIFFALGACALLLLASVASNTEQFTSGGTGAPPARNVLPIEANLAQDKDETPRVENPIELPQPTRHSAGHRDGNWPSLPAVAATVLVSIQPALHLVHTQRDG